MSEGTALRCGNCRHWLGESSVPLIFVEVVGAGFDVKLAAPRDLRLCKKCHQVNVFVPRSDIDGQRATSLASG